MVLRLAYFSSDTLNFDEYACMLGVHSGFGEYYAQQQGGYTLPLLAHYWVTARVLGAQLWEYRLASLLASMLLLVLAVAAIRVVRPKASLVVSIGLVLWLGVSSYSLFTASYAMVSYSVSLLASATVFFLLLFLVRTSLKQSAVIWLSVCFIPLAFFSLFTIVVPVMAGIVLLLAYRIRMSWGQRWRSTITRWALDVVPLLVFVVLQGVVYVLNPFTNYGAIKRPDLAPYYFGQSGIGQSVSGALRFIATRTYWTARSTSNALDSSILTKVALVAGGVLACVALAWALRRPRDGQVLFAAAYTIVLGAACAVGAIAGLYPYGSARYEYFLIVPVGFLVAQGLAIVVATTWGKLGRLRAHPRSVNAVAIMGVGLILACTVFVAWDRSRVYVQANRRSEQWFATVAERENTVPGGVIVLCDAVAGPVVTVRLLPGLESGLNSIGYGSYWGEAGVPAVTREALRQNSMQREPDSLLLVLWGDASHLAQFPSVARDLERAYVLRWSVQGPYLWAGLYAPARHRPSAGL